MSAEGTTTTTTTTAPIVLASDPAWAGFDDDTKGVFQTRGWDKLAPAEAAREALKSYREAEKLIGVPKEQILKLPKDASDEAGWNAVRTRLGVPEKADQYDLSGVKFSDGTELDPEFVSVMAPALHKAGVAKDNAPEVVRAVVKFMEDGDKAVAAETAATVAKDADELTKSWGSNVQANTFIANQAAEKLGWGKDVLDKFAGAVGRVQVAQALLKIGQMMGEDKFVSGNSVAPGVMTREQAIARYNELKQDKEWIKKVDAGDARANTEFNGLMQIISGA